MQDLMQASELAFQIGLAIGFVANVFLRERPRRVGIVVGLVFLGWSLVFYLSQYLPWTFLGL